jgi:hypothetical protein
MPIPFIGISFGLLEHRKRMGNAVWLYLFLHTRADFRDSSGLVKWTKEEASQALDTDARSILRWYQMLKDEAYVRPVGDDLVVEKTCVITRYKSAMIMGYDRNVTGGDNPVTPAMTDLSPPSLLYKYSRYKTLKGFFEALLDIINQAHNPIAELRRFWAFVWGPEELPSFGRLGEAAKRAGNGQSRPGCRVLARRSVVAAVGRRVIGNPVDYVQNMKGVMGGPEISTRPKGTGATGSARHAGPGHRRLAAHEPEWQEPDHGDWARFVLTGSGHGGPGPEQAEDHVDGQ